MSEQSPVYATDERKPLERLRAGHLWLVHQHSLWLNGEGADDVTFSRALAGWYDLEYDFRGQHGFAGCIFGPEYRCDEDFKCFGCIL